MSINFYEENDAGFSYSGFATVDTNAINSNARAVRSTVQNDTATFTFDNASSVPANGVHAIYLGHQAAQDYGQFTYTIAINGTTVFTGTASQVVSGQQAASNYYGRCITPLWREPNGVDRQKVVVTITNSSSSKCSVDFLVAMSHPKTAIVPGRYVGFGDSWTVGSGPVQTWAAFAPQLTTALRMFLRRQITLSNQGRSGEALFARSSTILGAMWRTIQDDSGNSLTAISTLAPEFMTILFGANDLSNVSFSLSAWDYARQLAGILCMIEDSIDVYGTEGSNPIKPKYLVCTPPWLGPGALTAQFPTITTVTSMMGRQNLEAAAALTRLVVAQFPWATLCDTFAALDYRSMLMTPNNQGDLGLHPNDSGHAALLGAMLAGMLQGIG